MKYTVIIEKGRESGYVAHVPTLRGCASQGETKDEALAEYTGWLVTQWLPDEASGDMVKGAGKSAAELIGLDPTWPGDD